MTPVRIVCVALFIAVMAGVRYAAHIVVDAGALAWLAAMAAIFIGALMLENRDRRTAGRAPYSLAESRELLWPLSILALVMTAAYWAG